MRNPHRFVSNTHSFPKNTRFIGKKPIGTVITNNHCLLTHVPIVRILSYPQYYTLPWTHFYGSIVTPIPYKMKKYIKMKERYVTIIKKKKCEEIEKNERNERNERYIPFIPLISFHSSV